MKIEATQEELLAIVDRYIDTMEKVIRVSPASDKTIQQRLVVTHAERKLLHEALKNTKKVQLSVREVWAPVKIEEAKPAKKIKAKATSPKAVLSRKERIENFFQKNKKRKITPKELMRETKDSSSTVYKVLNNLVAQKKIKRVRVGLYQAV